MRVEIEQQDGDQSPQAGKELFTEAECYERFRSANIGKLGEFAVPELIRTDPRLFVIEMRIVTPPFILDFAKAWLDRPMEFEEGGYEEWLEDCRSRFEDRWPRVKALLSSLRQFGIYYYDAKPANITVKDDSSA